MARAVQAVVRREVLLARELRHAVGRERLARVILVRRPVALAVDRAAGRAEHDLRAVPPRGLEHLQRPDDVHVRVEVGAARPTRARPPAPRGGSRARARASSKTRPASSRMSRSCETRAGGRRSRASRERSSRTCTSSPRATQRIDDVRPDEARASGDDRPHAPYRTAACSSPSRASTARARPRRWSSSPRRSRRDGREVVATREPGGTELGEAVRAARLHRHEMIAPGPRPRCSPRRAPSWSSA